MYYGHHIIIINLILALPITHYNSKDKLGSTGCIGPAQSLARAAFGRDACLVSGYISKQLIRTCLIVSNATIAQNTVRGHRTDGPVMNTTAKIALIQWP